MTPVDQSCTDGVHGDCLSAAVASILDLPLEQVPAFVSDHVTHGGDTNAEEHWWTRLIGWLRNKGHWFAQFDAADETTWPEVGEHYLVFGHTIRGTYHAVVYVDGHLAHDPHPSREGVLAPDRTYTIRTRTVPGQPVTGATLVSAGERTGVQLAIGATT